MWKDELLTWDQSEYNGIDVTRIRAENIWKPDIQLYNRFVDQNTHVGNVLDVLVGIVMALYPFFVEIYCSNSQNVVLHCYIQDLWCGPNIKKLAEASRSNGTLN